jgi:ATP-dependent DNA ligase
MKHQLYNPARCTATLPNELEKEYLISERKMDGSRYVLYLNGCPYERQKTTPNTLLSRRPSSVDGKLVDKSLNAPHITSIHYSGLEGTVLDGEIMADNFGDTNSIMNSSPALATQKQNEQGKVKYFAFDILSFRGTDVRGLPLAKRRKVLEEVVRRMNNEHVIPIEQFSSNHIDRFNEIVAEGGEGIIVKDLRMGYGVGWSKFKKSTDISCIVTGYKEGNGKYSGQVGALAISVYFNGKLLEVGFASGFDDKLRADMSRDFERYKGRVVDIFAQEISKDNRLRHPTFHRFRDDYAEVDCTLEKLKGDFKKKTMFTREK